MKFNKSAITKHSQTSLSSFHYNNFAHHTLLTLSTLPIARSVHPDSAANTDLKGYDIAGMTTIPVRSPNHNKL